MLQHELRSFFADRPILISVVTNGTLAYLLPRDLYGGNLYQDLGLLPGAAADWNSSLSLPRLLSPILSSPASRRIHPAPYLALLDRH